MIRRKLFLSGAVSGFILAAVIGAPEVSHAGGTLKLDDTRWINIGAGLRSSFNSVEDASPGLESRSKDFQVDSVRLYVSGQMHKFITFEYNT
ncbi:MAG TPA: hypothetical protein VI702_05535, partial [Nitrospiria bacterium]